MNKYNVKLKNNKIIGPFDLIQIKELIDSGRVSFEDYFKLFPVGSWEQGLSIQEIGELKAEVKEETVKEFPFEKKDRVEDFESDKVVESSSTDDGVDEEATVILNTQKFRKLDDKTKVLNVESFNSANVTTEESSDEAASDESKPEEVEKKKVKAEKENGI